MTLLLSTAAHAIVAPVPSNACNRCLLVALLSVLLLLALPRTVDARAAGDLFPHAPYPGGIARVAIGESGDQPPEVRFDTQPVALLAGDTGWTAVVGIPLGTMAGTHHLEVRYADGTAQRVPFEIRNKSYTEQRITITDSRKVNPSTEDMLRINRERRRLIRQRRYRQDTLMADTLMLPVEGPISSPFGLRRFFNDQPRRPHGGIDIAVPEGTPIRAPADGVVIEAGDYFFNGNCVFLAHGLGLQTFFAHMSRIDVKLGDVVQAGDVIGLVGATGRVTGPHLHWSVSLNNTWIDPELLIGEPAPE